MADTTQTRENNLKKILLQSYFLLVVLAGCYAIRSIVNIPGEKENTFLFGFTIERLLLLSIVLGVSLCFAWLLIQARWKPAAHHILFEFLSSKLDNPRNFGGILILCIIGIFNSSNFLLWISEISEPVTLSYYIRLQPFFWWIAILSGLTLVVVHLIRNGFRLQNLLPRSQVFSTFCLTFGFFLVVWVWIGQSRYGVEAVDRGIGWISLGIPILETQILLAWGLTLGFLGIWSMLTRSPNQSRLWLFLKKEAVIWCVLWLVAFSVWMSQPLKPNWFASEPRPPNFTYYPNSDTSVYDVTAQNLLLGEGFKSRGSPYTYRPMYAFTLAIFHKIGGLSYEPIIWMQVAVLAFIPVLLYAITERLHHRFSGILAALLIILRERNSIFMSDMISNAHAKLLMPFLPTALGVLLFIWLVITWLRDPQKRPTQPLASGGIVGIFMLIRPEFGILLLFIGLAVLFELRGRFFEWVKWMGLLLIGLTFALGPWVWRNYQITGTIFIDSPYYRLDMMSRRYRDEPVGFKEPTPTIGANDQEESVQSTLPTTISPTKPTPSTSTKDISEKEPDQDNIIQSQTELWYDSVVHYINANPLRISKIILKHFMNSVIQTVQVISPTYPVTYSMINSLGYKSFDQFWLDCCSLSDYDRRLPYWTKWDGVLFRGSFLPIAVNLALIAIGISITWEKRHYTGLIPLFALFGYYLINAVVRNSGGRYIIPLDWVGILYFSIGLLQVTAWGKTYFKKSPSEDKPESKLDLNNTQGRKHSTVHFSMVCTGIGILIIGSLLPMMEWIIPTKRDDGTLSTRISLILNDENSFLRTNDKETIIEFLANDGMPVEGYALYPRYHESHQMRSVWNFYDNRSYSLLDFYLSSPTDKGIVLALDETPLEFPHVSDVLVFACPGNPDYDALAVVRFSDDGIPLEIFWRFPMPAVPSCPMPPIK